MWDIWTVFQQEYNNITIGVRQPMATEKLKELQNKVDTYVKETMVSNIQAKLNNQNIRSINSSLLTLLDLCKSRNMSSKNNNLLNNNLLNNNLLNNNLLNNNLLNKLAMTIISQHNTLVNKIEIEIRQSEKALKSLTLI
jgi:hypothetical protein